MKRTFSAVVVGLSLLSAVFSAPAFAASGSVTYTYDSRGRLVQANYPSSHAENYNYDAADNRTSSSSK